MISTMPFFALRFTVFLSAPGRLSHHVSNVEPPRSSQWRSPAGAAFTHQPAARSAAAIHGLADLGQALEAARSKAHAKARAAVASARFRRLLLDLCAWVETGDWLAALEDGGGPAGDFAAHTLARRRRKLSRKGRGLSDLDDAARHQVRIEAKKLRYALDFLGSLWPPEALHDLTEALVQAQELLGQMNDRVSAQHLLTTAPQAGAARLQMVLGAQLVQSAAQLPLALKAVMQAPTPWK